MPNDFQVVNLTYDQVIESIDRSLKSQHVKDYTFEERYERGTTRVNNEAQNELDEQHYIRLEALMTRNNFDIFSVFQSNRIAHPKKIAAIWMNADVEETHRWNYEELYERARNIAAHLVTTYQQKKGDRVLLAYEPCIEFFAAFWACVGTGIIAVPVCPPDPFNPHSDMTNKVVAIWRDAEPKLALTSRMYKDSVAAARMYLGEKFEDSLTKTDQILDFSKKLWIGTDELTYLPQSVYNFPAPGSKHLVESDTVFLQYTSGSTGGAKGVEVSHRQLSANCMNCAQLTQGMGSLYVYQYSLGVSWLPTFHDMGLIGFHVAPMLIGGSMVYFSPLDFIQNPIMWLKIVSKYRHVSSGAPPFALDLCARRVTNEELSLLDLSGLEVLILGAEPIRASYMEVFAKKFQNCGFNAKAYMTCFGMAENILHVAGKWSNMYEVRKILVDTNALTQHRVVVYKDEIIGKNPELETPFYTAQKCERIPEGVETQWLVSSGEVTDFLSKCTALPEAHTPELLHTRVPHFYRRDCGTMIAIVDPNTQEELLDGQVGEIWIMGPSKAKGYYKKEQVNKDHFRAKLKKANKKTTQALLKWAKEYKPPTSPAQSYQTLSKDLVVRSEHPVLDLAATSVNAAGEVEWLRSGDMGVIVEQNLYITGRIKDMIIIRGQNYYADDLEYAVAGDAETRDVAPSVTEGPTDESMNLLGCLRFGSAIAYSIQIEGGSDRVSQACQGEHVCIMVELADDIKVSNDVVTKAIKHGNQMAYWKQFMFKYGGDLLQGLSKLYEAQEAKLVGSTAVVPRQQLSCNDRVKATLQHGIINSIKFAIKFSQSWLGSTANAIELSEDELEKDRIDEIGHLKNLPADSSTLQMRATFDEKKLDEISSAIRRVISRKFMLQVGQIIFLSPKTIRKTSSGKKRRADMIRALNGSALEHKVVYRSYSKQLKAYYQIHGNSSNTTANAPLSPVSVQIANQSAATTSNNNNSMTGFTNTTSAATTTHVMKNSVIKPTASTVNHATSTKFGGTVGIALDGQQQYTVDNSNHINLVAKSFDATAIPALLDAVEDDTYSDTAKEELRLAMEVSEKIAAELTFTEAKARTIKIIVKKMNAKDTVAISEELLYEMSTKSAMEQQDALEEYGLDSMTGFELAKAFADEFGLPASMMTPHLFLQTPTIDGMVGVMMKLVELRAIRVREEYTVRLNSASGKVANAVLDENTSAYMFRGSTDDKRIPYVLALGTAVPFSCGPQSEVMQAMLGPMKMNKKSEDRFIRINENSGVQTRYSALNSLDQVFWGKEGVNQNSDEYIDARHAVYAVEAAKLSVKSAADALHDWMGAKVLKNDEQREQERLERYLEVDKKHRAHISKKRESKKKNIKYDEQELHSNEVEEDWTDLARRVEAYTDRQITHVVAVTCTGILVPGLEFHIMKGLGLPLTTQRLSIQFMGCFGAVSGIRCASALAAENPRNRVLVVCTELCTLHMQLNDKVDNLVASALFADGSGAMVVGCDPSPTERPLFAVHQCSSFIIPNTLEMMGWDMTRKGLIIGLAKEIASEIFNHIGDFVNNMLTHAEDSKHPGHRIGAKDCNLCLHPGGPLILNTIQNVLNVPQVGDGHGGGDIDPTLPSAESWEILREYGNMSSATLVFCLDRMREKAYKTDKWTPMVAFGPGLSIEGTLLKAVFPAANKDGTYNTTVKAEQQVFKANKSTAAYTSPLPKDVALNVAATPHTAV